MSKLTSFIRISNEQKVIKLGEMKRLATTTYQSLSKGFNFAKGFHLCKIRT